MKCWGYNAQRQLGDGTTTSSNTPVEVAGLTQASQVEISNYKSCAVIGSGVDVGKVKCWGYGYGVNLQTIDNLNLITKVSVGSFHTCALIGSGVDSGKVKCWGNNQAGQLGIGTTDDVPVGVSFALNQSGFQNISVGDDYEYGIYLGKNKISCGVNQAGDVYCTGDTTNGKSGSTPTIRTVSGF